MARQLRKAGVRPGQLVGLMMPRVPQLPVALLAILKVGGAYVPIEPDYPPERVECMLRDCGTSVLVIMSNLPIRFAFNGVVVHADKLGPATAAPESDVTANDLAYVMYTSGTAGRPKGVQVTHRNLVRLVRGTDYADFSAETRILPTCAIVFDPSSIELWGSLLNGGSMHLVENDVVLSAAELGTQLAEHGINTMQLVTPLFSNLVEQDPSVFRSLRQLIVGGEALPPRHVAKVLAACPDLRLVNAYGPTENTTISTTYRVTHQDVDRIPIGRPIANSRAYVFDADRRLCPIGVPGELWLGGAGVARGYLNQPELTAENFAPDPFVPHGRMYRSGDLARWRQDGVLEFLGRRDHQVKMRGFRIEPGEVENALLGHPAVSEAVVVARQRPGGTDRYLCGYYVTGKTVNSAELRAHLAQKLPVHMVPAYLVELSKIPLNHGGKVDRSRLPEPDGSDRLAEIEYLAPRDDVEQALVELAERSLGITGIGVRHDLRDLGADSLTATLLAANIEARFGNRIPVSAVLRAGAVESLAGLVRQSESDVGLMIQPAPQTPSYPLTPQQCQLYVEQLKDESALQYNAPCAIDLPATVNVARLADALRRLGSRHDALRTEFRFDGAEIRQFVRTDASVLLDIVDGPAPPAREFVRSFDLREAPLWRAVIYRSVARVRLLLDMHHIITDGFSLVSMVNDLAALYAGEEPPPPQLQYRDYAHWLAGPAGAELRAEQASYWREAFARPRSEEDLPLDFPRPAIRALDGDVVNFNLGPQRASDLWSLARQHDVTLFAALAAVHSVLLAGLTGSPDVTLGTPVSGRTAPGLHRTLGMFVNTVCLRTMAEPCLTFTEFLGHVGRVAEEAFAHQGFPFEELVTEVAGRRDYRRNPMFDAMIALHSDRYLHADFDGARIPVRLELTGQSVFDLNMQIYDIDSTLLVSWQYGSKLFLRSTIEGWRDAFMNLIDKVLADHDVTVGELTVSCGALSTSSTLFDFDF